MNWNEIEVDCLSVCSPIIVGCIVFAILYFFKYHYLVMICVLQDLSEQI